MIDPPGLGCKPAKRAAPAKSDGSRDRQGAGQALAAITPQPAVAWFRRGPNPLPTGRGYLSLEKSIVPCQMSVMSKIPSTQPSSLSRLPEYQVVSERVASIGAMPA